MKRDMDLIRLILIEVEKMVNWSDWEHTNIEDYTHEEISYHVMLLKEAGLIEAKGFCDGGEWIPGRLTWDGHEFLDSTRNETVWKKVKGKITEMGGGLAFEVIKFLSVTYSKELMKIN